MCADNSARFGKRYSNLARRIAVFDRAFFHVSDQTASAIASLYLSANHRAVFDTFSRISLMTDKCADFIPSLNLRIANHDIPNSSGVCIAKQPFRVFISGNFQAGNRVSLSVEYARKRTIGLRRVRIERADGRPVGIARQIDIVRQQIGLVALAVARVHLVGEPFELLGRGDVNRGLAAEHPARQFA